MSDELRLILLRHAKSSWKSGAKTDHARPLNNRGKRDAPRIGRALAERDWIPDLVISSDSERTRQTFALMQEALGSPKVVFTSKLYHAGTEEVRAELSALSKEKCVMLVGHNYGWEHALTWLTGQEERMTTTNAALMRFGGTWAEAVEAPSKWTLDIVLRPKELEDL